MPESKEVIATVITDREEIPEFIIPLRGADIQSLARHISTIEVDGEAAKALASLISKIVQLFVKRNADFSIANFIRQCEFGDDKTSPAIVAANAIALKASLDSEISSSDAEAMSRLCLAALESPPLADDEDSTLEMGAMPGGPALTVGDKAFITKSTSRHVNQGPFEVVEVNMRTNVVVLLINNTRQDYKSFNLRKA